MFTKLLYAIPLGILMSCNSNDKEQEKLYAELRKEHEVYINAQSKIDTSFKKTEEEMLVLKEEVQKELGFFSSQFHQFNESLNKYMAALEDKAQKHNEVVHQQAVLEDEIQTKKIKYNEVLERKEEIRRKREKLEKEFQRSLSLQDTLMVKAKMLINKS